MSVHTSWKQTGVKTAIVKFEKKPVDDQDTKPSFVVKTDPAIAAVKAFIGFLLGFPPLDASPEPRFPAPQGPSHSSRGIVVKFSGTQREHEAAIVMSTLLTLFCFDGPFVLHFSERAQPVPSPSRPTVEQAPSGEKAHASRSGPSWPHLPSRAGQEASGIPLFPRQPIDDPLEITREERVASTETVETSASEHLAEETGFRTDAPNEMAAAATRYDFQAYQAALNTPPIDADSQAYEEELRRLKDRVAASTDGTPGAIEAAWHRQYLEELQNPKVAVSASTEHIPEPSNAESQGQNLNVEPKSASAAPEATNAV